MNLKGFDSLKDLDYSKYFCFDCGARTKKVDEITKGLYKLEPGIDVISCTNPSCVNNIDNPLNSYTRAALRDARRKGEFRRQLAGARDLDSQLGITVGKRRRTNASR